MSYGHQNAIFFPIYVKTPEFSSIFCFPNCSRNLVSKQLSISHELQLRFTKTLHRCILLVDIVMWIYLVSSNITNSLFEGPKVKCYASCWNHLAHETNQLPPCCGNTKQIHSDSKSKIQNRTRYSYVAKFSVLRLYNIKLSSQ